MKLLRMASFRWRCWHWPDPRTHSTTMISQPWIRSLPWAGWHRIGLDGVLADVSDYGYGYLSCSTMGRPTSAVNMPMARSP